MRDTQYDWLKLLMTTKFLSAKLLAWDQARSHG